MDTEKVNKIWKAIKAIVEIILAAIAGGAAATTAKAAGLLDVLASL